MLPSTPLTRRGSSFHLGGDVEGLGHAVASEGSSSEGRSSSSHGSEAAEGEENKPAAANRAVTPPPARLANKPMPPPGLGIMASPMKIECHSNCFEGFGTESVLRGLTLPGDLIKVRPVSAF